VPFADWLRLVKGYPSKGPDGPNPALVLVDFLEDHFIRMSCGGVLLGTANIRQHSPALASLGPVSDDIVRLYVQSWKNMGFISS
jgi:hypothetical protein